MVNNQSTPAHRPHILHSRVDWLHRPYVLDYILYFETIDNSHKFFFLWYIGAGIECGGNYTDASAFIVSPSYPHPYPRLMDCIYLITQPNGTYVNISFFIMDINCNAAGSDYIELRDGNTQDSHLMAKFCGNGSNVPALMQTTQHNLRIRWKWWWKTTW